MTRERTWALTVFSAALFIVLSLVFAEGLFTAPLWNGDDWPASPLITYVLILVIVLAGWYQARGIPEGGIPLRVENTLTPGQVNDPVGWRLLMGNVYFALFWLPLRFFVGREWFSEGARKVTNPEWMDSGVALRGFWEQAVVVPEGERPPITYAWFRDFLQYMLDNGWYTWFAKLIVWGEILVALGLILGGLVGVAAFVGGFMNWNYMLAGSASTNPVLFPLSVSLVLAWTVAGYWGLDRWLLPALGTRWERAKEQVEAVSAVAERGTDTRRTRAEPRPGAP
jgi:thiosulfate dehydrogenase [quinone] large subunit